MVTQKMGSQDSLPRQGSLYSLTLDEFQTQLGNLGKPVSSMNLDELLRTVWSAESNENGAPHSLQLASGSSPPSSLNSQSSFSVSRGISKKTVDEVWREIMRGKTDGDDGGGERRQERYQALGEMTLEDFLMQAGLVVEQNEIEGNDTCSSTGLVMVGNIDPSMNRTLIQYPQQQQTTHGMTSMFLAGHDVGRGRATTNIGGDSGNYSDNSVSPSALMGTLSDTQQAPEAGRKRVAATGDVVEKTVERRQKRMIKNRESAARSRARKQAYTNELENKVSRLEEENERLRRMKEVEKALPRVPPPEPKYRLRRTSSAPL